MKKAKAYKLMMAAFTIVLFVLVLTGCSKEVKVLHPLDKKRLWKNVQFLSFQSKLQSSLLTARNEVCFRHGQVGRKNNKMR
jgi:hypothetical protein